MTQVASSRYWEGQSVQISDDLGIFLLQIDHAELVEPIRCASSLIDVVSEGITWKAWPMFASLPSQGGGAKRGSLAIQNVDPKISQTVRVIKGKFDLAMKVVSREDHEDVYYEHEGLFLKNVSATDLSVQGEVVGYGDESQPWPKKNNTPDRCPAVWA